MALHLYRKWVLLLAFFEGGVEGTTAASEVHLLGELACLASSELTVHTRVFPFNRKRTFVADVVQGSNDLFEVHSTSPRAAEVPAATSVAKVQVAGDDARLAVQAS